MTNSILNQIIQGTINGQAPRYDRTVTRPSQGLSAIMPKLGPPEEGSLLHSFLSGNQFHWAPKDPSEQVKMCKRSIGAGDVTGTIIVPGWDITTYTYSTLDPSKGLYKLTIKEGDGTKTCSEHTIQFNPDYTVSVYNPDGSKYLEFKLKTEARNGEQTLHAIAGYCMENVLYV